MANPLVSLKRRDFLRTAAYAGGIAATSHFWWGGDLFAQGKEGEPDGDLFVIKES